jgi:RNA polymerase sigma-70 factor (ECF subfamily)
MSSGDEIARDADSALMSRLRNGDETAMNALVHRFGPRLHRLICRLTGWSGDSDDILQEVFLTAWRKAGAFRGDGSLEGWLRQLAVNRCRNHHRARAAFTRMLGRAASRSKTATVNRLSQEESDLGELRIALAKLKRPDRAVLVLFYLEELSGEQVAEALGVRLETVHVRLHRARRRLRDLLKAGDESNEA